MNRREFLIAGASFCTAMTIPQIACATTRDYWVRDRVLWLRRVEKNKTEEFRVVFWSQGIIDPDNYIRLCYLLRDASASQTVMMDVNLLNLLYGIQYWQELLLGRPVPLIINSGYRTPSTNAKLEKAAEKSMHLYGRAADIDSQVYTPDQLVKMAAFFRMGGIGRYATHAHVDSGRVRYWDGSKRRKG